MNEVNACAASFAQYALPPSGPWPLIPRFSTGGWLNTKNSGDYRALAGIIGLMVGTAGLEPDEFAAIGRARSPA